MKKIANCHLCGEFRPLRHSHIWPAFAYKEYISDLSRGGSFCDLMEMRQWNHQKKEYWFCESCEGEFEENYTRWLLKSIEKHRDGEQPYDGRLERFAVSMSFRVAKFYMPNVATKFHREILKRPCRIWKEFLLQKRPEVRPFSQHAFIHFGDNIEGKDVEWSKVMGGEIFADERLILSRVGPLLIIGLLDRQHLSKFERKVWSLSELSSKGGNLIAISKRHKQVALTDSLVNILNSTERGIIKKAALLQD